MKPYWFSLLIVVFAPWALAHNVIGGVYVIGDTIEGEAGFSNGDMAPAGVDVIVTNPAGVELGRTHTQADGTFRFQPDTYVDHTFSLDLGAGHQLTLTLTANELPTALLTKNSTIPTTVLANTPASEPPVLSTSMQQQIETAVARQIKPLRRELRELKTAAGLHDIVAGIGYILGLCGLAVLIRDRHRKKPHA